MTMIDWLNSTTPISNWIVLGFLIVWVPKLIHTEVTNRWTFFENGKFCWGRKDQ